MNDIDLNWRAEEACMKAWPSPRETMLDGWLLRAGGGAIRRTNSVNPLRGDRAALSAVLPRAEAVYGALGQSALFRVPSFVDGMDDVLAKAGYAEEGRTLTLFFSEFCEGSGEASGITTLLSAPDAAWLQARARLNAVDAAEMQHYEAMLALIAGPRMFAALRHEGAIAAIAYCVLHDGLAVIESVVTDPALRRRGLGRRSVGSLLAWARSAGAEAACLQVVADNAPAVSLYRALGFTRELYRYRYFRKVPA